MTSAFDPDRVATVAASELHEWASLVAFVEEWLGNSEIETRDDFAYHAGPGGPRLADVVSFLDHMAVRMRGLAGGAP